MLSRTIVYIDGFNLYYGAVKDSSYKWLNIQRFFTLLRPADDLRRIYYFTALIDGPHRPSQVSYLKALETLPLVTVFLGKFKTKQVQCRVRACEYQGDRTFNMPEEKRTDVNIAVQMLQDAHEDNCDLFVVVSGDSDLVPAVNRVKNICPRKKVFVYVPARDPKRGAAVELRSAADKDKSLPLNILKFAQFPRRIPDGAGNFIERPSTW